MIGSSSAPVVRLGALAEFADHALGVGVVDAHTLADLRSPVEQILGVSDAGAGGLALDDVMLRLTNDGTAISAALGLRGERVCGIPEHLRGDRLGLRERVAAWRAHGAPSIRRRLLGVHI